MTNRRSRTESKQVLLDRAGRQRDARPLTPLSERGAFFDRHQQLRLDPHRPRLLRADRAVVEGRGHQARDHQLPHAQAGARRPLLRAHLRSHQGLGVLLRQVQARPLQGHHLRALRRRSDAGQGAPRAHGPHQARGAGQPHLVLQGRAEPHGLPARHRPQGAREGPVLRRQLRHHHRQRREAHRRPRPAGRQGRLAARAARRLRAGPHARHRRDARGDAPDHRRRARRGGLPQHRRAARRIQPVQLLRHLRDVPPARRPDRRSWVQTRWTRCGARSRSWPTTTSTAAPRPWPR